MVEWKSRLSLYIFRAKAWVSFWLKATNEHGIHSPFVYNLYTTLLFPKQGNLNLEHQNPNLANDYRSIEQLRVAAKSNPTVVRGNDLGTGLPHAPRTIKHIATNALKSPAQALLLARLVSFFQPQRILELGTSLGITTLYFAKSLPKSEVITIEGNEEISKLALSHFETLKANNIKQIQGNIDVELPKMKDSFDFVFFDGNHRKVPTLNYFEHCLKKANHKSVFVFDDIHWSPQMEEAWTTIQNHPAVTVTIDLFYLGIVFFHKGQSKENFSLK